MITAYVTFLTWSGLTNGHDPVCNPSLTIANSTNTQDGSVVLKFDRHIAIGIIVLVFSVLYSTLRSSTKTSAGKFLISVSVYLFFYSTYNRKLLQLFVVSNEYTFPNIILIVSCFLLKTQQIGYH